MSVRSKKRRRWLRTERGGAEAAALLLRPFTVDDAREMVRREIRKSLASGCGMDIERLRRRLLERVGVSFSRQSIIDIWVDLV